MMSLPDLCQYRLHRVDDNAEFEGVAVAGLRAEIYHRDDGGHTASVGRYWYAGRELLMAWGYVDEEHCRSHAVRGDDGAWHPAALGCPDVRVVRDQADPDAPVTGFAVRDPHGRWITGTNSPVTVEQPPPRATPVGR
jgi:hypothetical protein